MELTQKQKVALQLFSTSPLAKNFYWTGGTLLSYHYLQHRLSEDLDFFTDQIFTFEEVNSFIQELKKKADLEKVSYQKVFDRHEFLLENSETLRIEFVLYNHDKKTLGAREKLLGVTIDSLEDIAANKTMAYFDRVEPKDLYDIYFLIQKKGFTPEKLQQLVFGKFGVNISESSFWSEAFKIFPLLSGIKPLIIGTEEEKENIMSSIEKYFKNGSEEFLKKNLT